MDDHDGRPEVSLSQQDVLKPGDTIRTGRNGRVLLVRGAETILISPNSAVGLPTENKDGLSTTIVQQAGSIMLEVEKRNVKHFEVDTPYLAAVVKGTQFRVSVNAASTSIEVIRGQVEVADFRSGQVAQVMPGQLATASAHGKPGLSLSGSGTFAPIEQGRPRASTIQQLMVPKSGLSAPRHAANGQLIRALGHNAHAMAPSNSGARGHSATRISVSLGEVRLNFNKVTHGLAREVTSTPGSARSADNQGTIWNSSNAGAVAGAGNGSSQGNSKDGGNGNGNSNGDGSGNARGMNASGMAAATAAAGNGSGSRNGANASGNGNGATGNGSGNAHGHGRGH